MDASLQWLLLVAVLPLAQAPVPGTFYWKPRVGLDLVMPQMHPRTGLKPTRHNIYEGRAVLIDGYQAGLTVAALAGRWSAVRDVFPHLHPGHAHYYTNAYRWAKRHLSLIPDWLGGKGYGMNYINTHKVWNKRYIYLDSFVPQWMRKVLFFVPDKSWDKEEWEWKKYVKYAEPLFSKYYQYPSKKFNDFQSQRHSDDDVVVSDPSHD